VLGFEVGLFGWMAVAHYVIWKPALPMGLRDQLAGQPLAAAARHQGADGDRLTERRTTV
jgi:hypothetical protein